METRTVEKNGAKLTSVVELIKRGPAKDSSYAAFIPTKENINDWITFHGVDRVIDVLAAQARKDAQATLDYVVPEDKWLSRTVEDPETKKTTEVFYYNDADLDSDKFYEVLVSGVARGGVTKADLMEQQAEVNGEMATLIPKLASGDPQIAQKLMELGQKWQDLSSAIAAKSRERKSKTEVQAAA